MIFDRRYPVEELNKEYEDDGTMLENIDALAKAVVGKKIVGVENRLANKSADPNEYCNYYTPGNVFILTLDDGTKVKLFDTNDCCAYTELTAFLHNVEHIDHVILGVGTEAEYTTWHIYADLGDVLTLTVGWSCGNPFYYGYGFAIRVIPLEASDA